jgi:hypothetical protein
MSKEFEKFMTVVGNLNMPAKIESRLIEEITETIQDLMLDNKIKAEELKHFYNETKEIDKELGIDDLNKFKQAAIDDGRCEQCFALIEDQNYIKENGWTVGYICNCGHKTTN